MDEAQDSAPQDHTFRVFLVVPEIDRDIVTLILDRTVEQLEELDEQHAQTKSNALEQCSHAREQLKGMKNFLFSAFYVPQIDIVLPLCSIAFDDGETETIVNILTDLVNVILRSGASGWELKLLNDQRPTLSLAIQSTLELKMLASQLEMTQARERGYDA